MKSLWQSGTQGIFSENMVATGQEMVRRKIYRQGQGKVWEFYSESGQI